jgi:hypothetical protein
MTHCFNQQLESILKAVNKAFDENVKHVRYYEVFSEVQVTGSTIWLANTLKKKPEKSEDFWKSGCNERHRRNMHTKFLRANCSDTLCECFARVFWAFRKRPMTFKGKKVTNVFIASGAYVDPFVNPIVQLYHQRRTWSKECRRYISLVTTVEDKHKPQYNFLRKRSSDTVEHTWIGVTTDDETTWYIDLCAVQFDQFELDEDNEYPCRILDSGYTIAYVAMQNLDLKSAVRYLRNSEKRNPVNDHRMIDTEEEMKQMVRSAMFSLTFRKDQEAPIVAEVVQKVSARSDGKERLMSKDRSDTRRRIGFLDDS